jgi:hypothetical protein
MRSRRGFPRSSGPSIDDICYATQNRQTAVSLMVEDVDLMLVLGSRNSSNQPSLRDRAQGRHREPSDRRCVRAIDPAWFDGVARVGITAGASAPEDLVQDAIDRLRGSARSRCGSSRASTRRWCSACRRAWSRRWRPETGETAMDGLLDHADVVGQRLRREGEAESGETGSAVAMPAAAIAKRPLRAPKRATALPADGRAPPFPFPPSWPRRR